MGNNPLLMVKQFGERGILRVSPEFMTIADVPAIVSADMEHPVNPHLGTSITMTAKDEPLTVVSEVSFQPRRHGPYCFALSRKRELLGRDIFKAASWGQWQRIEP
jgi:hypothetical protein